ncbi:histidine phosphatase family protein [Listeria ilorinensis]|uniref:histidine phosphatase family protein n=1 Tax=Listeria ilorinensis TaxID=2867439 RepID=UPI001EF61BA9|nr:histidine phosphatase family protein [Listeria ilorinensis]
MTKTLYLMRHGQTVFNMRHKIQGWCDSPLTELGIAQAKLAAEYFQKEQITFDHAYSSTAERACDTLELVTNQSMPYKRLKGLREWHFGVFEGESEDLNPPHEPGATSYGDAFVKFGGEDSLEVQNRMDTTLREIMEQADHEQVLAVGHGGAMYMFIQKWEDFARVRQIRFSNCCILKFTYEAGEFQFVEAINHDFSALSR